MSLPECSQRHLADAGTVFSGPELKIRAAARKKGKKNGTPSGNSRSSPFFTQKAVNPSFPPQKMHIMAQNHEHFLLRKMGKMGQNPAFMGKKWGSFLSCISAIRQRVDHRDRLFEPPDMILYHEKTVIQGRIHAEREKTTRCASHTGWLCVTFLLYLNYILSRS